MLKIRFLFFITDLSFILQNILIFFAKANNRVLDSLGEFNRKTMAHIRYLADLDE